MHAGTDGIGDRVVDAATLFAGSALAFAAWFHIAGEETRAWWLQVTVPGLIVLTTVLLMEVRRQGRRLRAAEELLADVRFGPGTKRDRDAVDILVRALRVPDQGARQAALRTLKKISGLDLGEAPAPWEEWWSVARDSFVRPGAAPRPEAAPKK